MRLGAAFLALMLLFSISCSSVASSPTYMQEPEREVRITEYKDEEDIAWLWETLLTYTGDERITAGILGYYWRESFCKSNATTHWPTVNPYLGRDIPVEFTARIDEGLTDGSSRDDFLTEVHEQIGGYGLGQWYSRHFLEAFYDFARSWGTSIGDAEMQCAFAVESIKSYTELWEELLSIEDPNLAGARIGLIYDGSSSGYCAIAAMAESFYYKYADADGA